MKRWVDKISTPVLSPTEKRYFRDSKRPPPFELPEGVVWRRSCVWDAETKKARLQKDLAEVEDRIAKANSDISLAATERII